MHCETDLFGDIIVTKFDVVVWLATIPNLQGRAHSTRSHYALHYDVASKIKLSKQTGRFAELITQFENMQLDLTAEVEIYGTKYKADNTPPRCPPFYHQCEVITCACYLAQLKRDKGRAYRKRRKALSNRQAQ